MFGLIDELEKIDPEAARSVDGQLHGGQFQIINNVQQSADRQAQFGLNGNWQRVAQFTNELLKESVNRAFAHQAPLRATHALQRAQEQISATMQPDAFAADIDAERRKGK